ncbi:MAG: endonuclease/exonuclease/phosphatase family protein [Alistipes sp.]|nr:endonuclease/exonuclease/phosphatase family protein [Alistipes sp.]
MKRLLLLLCATLSVALCVAKKPAEHRIMSANIRITGLEADEVDGRRWDDRKRYMIDIIRSYKPDVVMMQEVIYDSYAYCKQQLKEYYAFGFEGPEMDPYTEGYHLIGKNVIFLRKSRYEIVSAGCYWLSDDPTMAGSISWNTNRARHANWVRVVDKKTGKQLRLIDIHLDHKSKEAKLNQAKMIVREAAQYQDSFPQIICADMNSRKYEEQVVHFTTNGWTDCYDALHNGVEFGHTAHAFEGINRPQRPGKGRIDYILTKGAAKALSCEVITDHKGNMYPSDHYFMLARIVIE